MRQRVAFLRTLLSGKPVLALDEPFAALDALTRAEMQRWLEEALARTPRTVVLVTHDVEEAVVLGDRVVVLSPRPGRVVAELPVGAAAPAPAHRRRRRRAARARAGRPGGPGVKARTIGCRRCCSSRSCSAPGSCTRGSAASTRSSSPRPTRSPRRCGTTAACSGDNFAVTAARSCSASSLSVVAGVGCAIAIHLSATLRRGVYPLLVASQTLPIVIIAPLLVAWFGYDIAPKLAIIALICFFPVTVTTLDALASVDPDASSSCARWTPRAGRSSAISRRPRRCRACSPARRSPWPWP